MSTHSEALDDVVSFLGCPPHERAHMQGCLICLDKLLFTLNKVDEMIREVMPHRHDIKTVLDWSWWIVYTRFDSLAHQQVGECNGKKRQFRSN
jgi:hypothetical protein